MDLWKSLAGLVLKTLKLNKTKIKLGVIRHCYFHSLQRNVVEVEVKVKALSVYEPIFQGFPHSCMLTNNLQLLSRGEIYVAIFKAPLRMLGVWTGF